MTILPFLRLGIITSLIWFDLAAIRRSNSSKLLIVDLLSKINFLNFSAKSVPPGSLDTIKGILFFFKYFDKSNI